MALARFDRYVLSLMLAVFAFFALVLIAVFWVNQAVRLFEQLIGDGQSALVFLEISLLDLPNAARLVLPVAAFVATLYATNRLAGESELVVMQATGFSPMRLVRPVAYFGLAVLIVMSLLIHWLVPLSRTVLAERRDEIDRNIVAGLLVEGTFVNPVPGITLYAREITELGELRQTFLSDSRGAGGRADYYSDRAYIVDRDSATSLVLVEGVAMNALAGRTLDVTRFTDLTFDIAPPDDGARREELETRELSTARLFAAAPADLERTGGSPLGFQREAHDRIATTLTAALSPALAFSILILGGFSRMGLVPQITAATLLVMFLQLVANAATDAAARSAATIPLFYLNPALTAAITIAALWLGTRPRRSRGVAA